MLSIQVDSRGKGEQLIFRMLKGKGVNVESKVLDVGDYVIGDRVFERKTVKDLLSSAIRGSKHLWLQLDKLIQFKGDCYFIIEGKLTGCALEKGLIRSILLRYKIPIVYTESLSDTIETLIEFYNRLNDDSWVNKDNKSFVTVKSCNVDEVRLLMLQCIGGIGSKKAKDILTVCPELFDVRFGKEWLLSKLCSVNGVTESKAKFIVQCFR